ncbi:MAG: hypothetical protein ISS34_06815, partial [Candidatus Omnitrophica bacterium]|nr:hypothetical protein [Candidatus Omnitrophota bacterium]
MGLKEGQEKNSGTTDGCGSFEPALDSVERGSLPITIMNWRSMRWVKIVSIILIGTFLFQQVSWAADFQLSTIIMDNLAGRAMVTDGADRLKKDVISNYDLIEGALEGKRPSRSGFLSPDALQEMQSSREREIEEKNKFEDSLLDRRLKDMEDDFDNKLKEIRAKKKRKFEDDEEPRSIARRGGAGGKINFTLGDWDPEGNPQTLNYYEYDDDGRLMSITSFDISDLNSQKWIDAGREIDGKDGDKFYGGYMDGLEEELGAEYMISKTVYKGDKEEERVDYILSDFDSTGRAYEISYYDYGKDGDSETLDEVRTYSLDGLNVDIKENSKGSEWLALLTEDRLTKRAIYEGEKKKEHVAYILDDYVKNSDGKNVPSRISVFDYVEEADGDEKKQRLTEVRAYDIEDYYGSDDWNTVLGELRSGDETTLGEYINDLLSKTLYSGSAGEEKIEQVFSYVEGELVERADYEYYEYDAKYSEHKKRALRHIFKFDTEGLDEGIDREKKLTDLNKDGRIDHKDALLCANGTFLEESIFDGASGRERMQQILYYNSAGEVVERKDYIYDKGKLANIFVFNTEGLASGTDRRRKLTDRDGNGKIDYRDALSCANGSLLEENVFEGRAGKEKIQQTLFYDSQGNIIERKDYIYDGKRLVRVFTFDTEGLDAGIDRRKKLGDEDSNGTIDYADAVLCGNGSLLEESIFTGRATQEKVDQILTYDSEGNVVERRDYIYENGRLTRVFVFDTEGLDNPREKLTDLDNNGVIDYNDALACANGRLLEESTFEGIEGREKIQQTISYDTDGNITERKDYVYEDGRLVRTFTFDTEGVDEGIDRRERISDLDNSGSIDYEDALGCASGSLLEEDIFDGISGREKIQQALLYDAEGNIVTRKDYLYEGRRLVSVFTFDTEGLEKGIERREKLGDLNNDGEIDYRDALLCGNGSLVEEDIFDGVAGRERIQQALFYDSEGNITSRKDYIYDGKRLAGIFTFNTDGLGDGVDRREKLGDLNNDGEIDYRDALLCGNGTLYQEDIFEGRAGKEKIQQSLFYDSDGSITERKDYIYEDGRLVRTFTFDTDGLGDGIDRRGALGDLDGNGRIDHADALLCGNGTLYEEDIFAGEAGKERIQESLFYDYEGNVIERKDYIYDGKRLVKTLQYDTAGLSEEEARMAGMGVLVEDTRFKGVTGREKVDYSTSYGDLSAREADIPIDPRDIPSLADDPDATGVIRDGLGRVTSFTLHGEDYTIVYDDAKEGRIDSIEKETGADTITFTFEYDDNDDKRLVEVEEYSDTFETTTYYSYQDAVGEELLSTVNNDIFLAEYIYDLDVSEGGDGFSNTLDKIKKKNLETGLYFQEVYYEGSSGKEVIDFIVSLAPDGLAHTTIKYYYGDEGAFGAGASSTNRLFVTRTYYNDAETVVFENGILTIDENAEYAQQAFYKGIKGRERIDFNVNYAEGNAPIGVTKYYYDGNREAHEAGRRPLEKTLEYIYSDATVVDEDAGTLTLDLNSAILRQEFQYEGAKNRERIIHSFLYLLDGTTIAVRNDYIYAHDAVTYAVLDYSDQDAGLDLVEKYITADLSAQDARIGGNGYLQSQTVYTGTLGQEYVTKSYSYRGGEIVERSEYTYHGDKKRVNQIVTYDLKFIADKLEDVSKLASTVTYYYDDIYKNRLTHTVTAGTAYTDNWISGGYTTTATFDKYGVLTYQITTGESYTYVRTGPDTYTSKTSGRYTTESVTIDEFGTLTKSRTTGVSIKEDRSGSEVQTGVYTTTSNFNTTGIQTDSLTKGISLNLASKMTGSYTTLAAFDYYGILDTQVTDGVSISYDGEGNPFESGSYITNATSIDGYGTVRESVTSGVSQRPDGSTMKTTGRYTTTGRFSEHGIQNYSLTKGISQNLAGKTTGSYTTQATFDSTYGVMLTQITDGISISYDRAGNPFESGSYLTEAISIDGYGTVRESVTSGVSQRPDGVEMKTTGRYTTTAKFSSDGQQNYSLTKGVSENLAGMATGSYTTSATFNATYGIMLTQVTDGVSISYDSTGNSFESGSYITEATSIDGYGTVRESVTSGLSQRPDGTEMKTTGRYTTTAKFSSDGQQNYSLTKGISQNLSSMATGSYTTSATFDVTYGIMLTQITDGISISYDVAGNSFESGSYLTEATSIDGYGTVRESVTSGLSQRPDGAQMKTTGRYTTTAQFSSDGQQNYSLTKGVSENLAGMATGAYTTSATFDATYGIMLTQITDGVSISYDSTGNSFESGSYTAEATSIDGYGTVRESVTSGLSQRPDGAQMKTTGRYTTTAKFSSDGQQNYSLTKGNSQNLAEMATGSYTTSATFNATYGIMLTQITDGISISYDAAGTSYESGSYTTLATSIDGYGTVRESVTSGLSQRPDGATMKTTGRYTTTAKFSSDGQQNYSLTKGISQNLSSMATGSYTTSATFDVTYGVMLTQITDGISISYDRAGNSFESGSYTTEATSIDGYGTVRESVTYGLSQRPDGVEMKTTGRYTTTAKFSSDGQQNY